MEFEIKLNKPDYKFLTGDLLEGTVTICNPCERPVRSVYVLVKGTAKISFVVFISQTTNNQTRHFAIRYNGEEKYLDFRKVFFGESPENEVAPQMYPNGKHSYEFSCAIPEKVPGTMSTKEVDLTYEVQVVVVVPEGPEITQSIPFHVSSVFDLNEDEELKNPVRVEAKKIFHVVDWPIKQEAICSVLIPQKGFVANQEIPVVFHIHNNSIVRFDGITYKLIRKVKAVGISAGWKEREREYETEQVVHRHVFRREQKTDKTITKVTGVLKVPEGSLPTCLHGEKVQTRYFVRVKFAVRGWKRNVHLEMPVTIGTIALANGLEENTGA